VVVVDLLKIILVVLAVLVVDVYGFTELDVQVDVVVFEGFTPEYWAVSLE
jgi:hypothetical protein